MPLLRDSTTPIEARIARCFEVDRRERWIACASAETETLFPRFSSLRSSSLSSFASALSCRSRGFILFFILLVLFPFVYHSHERWKGVSDCPQLHHFTQRHIPFVLNPTRDYRHHSLVEA